MGGVEMQTVIIQGVISIVVALIAALGIGQKLSHQLQISQAVTDTKIDELTREVREHNNFARRMPVVEEQIKVLNRRIDDFERKGA